MRIKKTSATTPIQAQVVNTYSDSQINSYSCDYINDLQTYNTTETRIGTWTDGKPIYRKSVVVETLVYSTANTEYELMTINNLKDIVELNGVLWASSRTYLHQLPYYNNGNITKVFYKTDGKIYFQSSDTWSNAKVIATVEYTKTTD